MYQVKRYCQATWMMTISYLRRIFRDKAALFFTFIFPVMFLLVFGALSNNDSDINFNVALVNNSNTQFSEQFAKQLEDHSTITVEEKVQTIDQARDKMDKGEIDSILELPKDFGTPNEQGLPSGKIVVYYEEANPQSGQTLASIMQGVLDDVNQQVTHSVPPFSVEQRSTKTANLSSFDFIFSGLLGFTILTLGFFGIAQSFPAEKKTGAFRRLRAAPIGPSQLIFANGLSYMVMSLLSLVAMFLVGYFVFDFNMRGDYFNLTIFILISIIVMFGFGLAIGGWAKNENQAAPLTNLVAFPLMFLSGVFFPRFLMPDWLQSITTYLPLTPIIDGLRLILTEGATLLSLGPQLAMLAAWTIIVYFIAIKLFRWA